MLAHSCTRFPCYLGMEINQCKDPMDNNKDCRVGQLTTVDADIVNGDVDVFTSLIKFKYLLPNVQFYVNPVRLLGDR